MLCPQMLVLFGDAVDTLGGRASMEGVGPEGLLAFEG